MNGALLEVRNLRVEFPSRRGTLLALDDITFSIAPGEVLGVVGESGAGKSMTGAAIIGLLEPPGRIARGEILLEGERIDNLPPDRMRRIRGRRIGRCAIPSSRNSVSRAGTSGCSNQAFGSSTNAKYRFRWR